MAWSKNFTDRTISRRDRGKERNIEITKGLGNLENIERRRKNREREEFVKYEKHRK